MTPTRKTSTSGPATAAAILAAHIDELGAIEKSLTPWRWHIAREEALRKAIRGAFDAKPAGEPFEAPGAKYVAMIGARGIQRTVQNAPLIKRIGAKLFASFATVTLGALETNVAPEIAAACVTSANSGPRSLKVFERAA